MAIVTVSSLTAKTPAKDDVLLIADQYKATLEDIEEYLNPNTITTGRSLLTVLGSANAQAAFAELQTRATAGNFAGLRIGDYIDVSSMTIDGTTYSNTNQKLRFIIAGFDTYYNVGDTAVSSHHILMLAKNCVFQSVMNSTATNSGGYPSSELKTFLNDQVHTGLVSAIGITPKTVRRLLDIGSNWAWTAETVFLPTEVEVFGTRAWGNNAGYSVGSSIQWPIFAKYPQARIATLNGSRWWWWEASIRTDISTSFCDCGNRGYAGSDSASSSGNGVRFAFLI